MSTKPYEQFADELLPWLKQELKDEARVFPFSTQIRSIMLIESSQVMVAVAILPGGGYLGFIGEPEDDQIVFAWTDADVRQKIVEGARTKLADLEGYKQAKTALEKEQQDEQE